MNNIYYTNQNFEEMTVILFDGSIQETFPMLQDDEGNFLVNYNNEIIELRYLNKL